jgi:hypothetical protein
MSEPRSRVGRAGAIALAALVAASASGARADGWSAVAEPRFQWTRERDTDQSGKKRSSEVLDLGQRYNLNVLKSLYPNLTLTLGGTFNDDKIWTTAEGVHSFSESWQGNGFGRLVFGSPVLGGSVGYERSHQGQHGTAGTSPELILETYRATAYWHPADFPQLDLLGSRSNTFDSTRRTQYLTTDDLLVSTDYAGISRLRLRYSLHYSNPVDHLNQVDTTTVAQQVQGTWDDKLFGGRTNAYLNANVASVVTSTTASGPGGTVSTQRLPIAGYSLVEGALDAPERDTLALNPGVVNGDLAVSAGVEIGFGVPLGDTAYRDVGVQFQDATTRVNTVYVWVNKALPSNVAGAFAWRALSSDDNVTWTEVPLLGAAAFGSFTSRFEITLSEVQARYLKVVVQPLPKTVTVDPRFSSIAVTEVQTLLVQPASTVVGRTSITTETFSGTAQTRLVPALNLAWDISGLVNHASQGPTTWSIANGLSLSRRLSRVWSVSARAQRQDRDVGAGHVGGFQWGSTLAAVPIPTLTAALTYGGVWEETPRGFTVQNSLTALTRADLYRGVNVSATGGASETTNDTGQRTRTLQTTANATVTPHRTLTMTSAYLYAVTFLSGGSAPAGTVRSERVDAGLSFSPFATLYLNGTVTRIIKGTPPTTLATGLVAFSPFPDGAIQLRLSHTESIDTTAGHQSQTSVAGIHWTIRSGVILDTSYTLLDDKTPATRSNSDTWFTILTITL